ncbi:MAG: dihydrodipicolinate synthase family protein [Candidatus Dormibacteraceae bacterium]
MAERVRLPGRGRTLTTYTLSGRFAYPPSAASARSRIGYAACHVVADPWADTTPLGPAAIDWEATLAVRRHIWKYGLGVAEAMDTAQRGMGLDWETSKELIRRSLIEARAVGGRIACGAQTDQLAPGSARSLEDVIAAYREQCQFVEGLGGQVVVMASRELARIARGPDDYGRVYGEVLSQLERPALIHWLGEVFDPELEGYWGHRDLDQAMQGCLQVLIDNRSHVEGIKLSLLDQRREVEMRRRLPDGMRMYTGDDFDYPTMIEGDSRHHSDALLGAFDLIAPAASSALLALDDSDLVRFRAILTPTVALSRHVFGTPTQYYKTGVVFAAYLNGHQDHFRMVRGMESARSMRHLAQIFRLADEAGLLRDPELAAARMRLVLEVAGIVRPDVRARPGRRG